MRQSKKADLLSNKRELSRGDSISLRGAENPEQKDDI
jgi:hypothetical protein